MSISDWSADVCSSDLDVLAREILDIGDAKGFLVGDILDGDEIIIFRMMMLAQPLRRPPAPNSGDNFKIMVRVILQPPHDGRDALLLRRQKRVDELTATFFCQVVEMAVIGRKCVGEGKRG